MNEYVKQAQDFLTKHDAMIRFHFVGKKTYFDGDIEPRNVYSVVISRDGKKDIIVTFGDSIYNTEKKIAPTCYDVLACLQKYPVDGDVFDFAEEFGYPIGDRKSYLKAFKIYDAVREEYEKVCSIFGDCLEELREIQ
jgi:hypothetical protein